MPGTRYLVALTRVRGTVVPTEIILSYLVSYLSTRYLVHVMTTT